jgi:hypothetical protein
VEKFRVDGEALVVGAGPVAESFPAGFRLAVDDMQAWLEQARYEIHYSQCHYDSYSFPSKVDCRGLRIRLEVWQGLTVAGADQ